jgi:hypothetical protein
MRAPFVGLLAVILLLGLNLGLALSAEAAPAAPAAAAAKGDAPPLTHRVRGMENCIRCHPVGRGRSPMPADHAGYTNDGCLTCHAAPIP